MNTYTHMYRWIGLPTTLLLLHPNKQWIPTFFHETFSEVKY